MAMTRQDAEKLLGLGEKTYTGDEVEAALRSMRRAWQPGGVLAVNTDPRIAAVMLERVEEAGRILAGDTESEPEPASGQEPSDGAEEDGSVSHSVAGGFLHAISANVRMVSLVLLVVFAGLLATSIESVARAMLEGSSSSVAGPVLFGAVNATLLFYEWRNAGIARSACRLCGRLAVGIDDGRWQILVDLLRALAKAIKVVGGFVFRWLKRYITS